MPLSKTQTQTHLALSHIIAILLVASYLALYRIIDILLRIFWPCTVF